VKKSYILTRSYKGGSLRQQAHTFANNTVETITGSPGIGLTRIAFKQKHGTYKEIHVADFDGHNSERLTHDNSIVAGPGWMPNNDTLYYCSYRRHNADILTVRPETEEEVAVDDRSPEGVVACLSIPAILVGQEPDRKGVFKRLFDLARSDVLQIEVNVQQVKFHEDTKW
jgi:hypothetical protein